MGGLTWSGKRAVLVCVVRVKLSWKRIVVCSLSVLNILISVWKKSLNNANWVEKHVAVPNCLSCRWLAILMRANRLCLIVSPMQKFLLLINCLLPWMPLYAASLCQIKRHLFWPTRLVLYNNYRMIWLPHFVLP
ncbi:hypothetical protein THIOM_005030 [Candidatus Thiomargarita nelsonii]|uniref:Uncharacterized protein n=1 Tax=Candidatus Thiomargarita nelsonii TaxID=1003181 RepID=A0A176RUA0_9GAMM|nr:hypothetical protein THIOM_005030 [Candidatus Thiomargarita nelsonii]